MPLVYLPEGGVLFLWGDSVRGGAVPPELSTIEPQAVARSATIVTPAGRREVSGLELPLLGAVAALAVAPAEALERSATVAAWVMASKLALELVARERVVPVIQREGGRLEARWAAALASSEDVSQLLALARSLPPAAHAVPAIGGNELDVWAPEALLRAFIDAVVDALLRSVRGAPGAGRARAPSKRAAANVAWDQRWREALEGPDRRFEPAGFAERSLGDDLERWSEPARGARDRLRACFRLELPQAERDEFTLGFLLQAPDDPSLLLSASEVWQATGPQLSAFGRAFRDPQESLLEALGRAAALFPPLARALHSKAPESLALDAATAWAFLGDGAAALGAAGFGVIVPGELTAAGARRLRLRMRVGGKSKVAGAVAGSAALGLDELLAVDWQAVIGEQALDVRELALLAKQKAPLVRFRGAWVAVDPSELADIRRRIAGGPGRIPLREALQAALAGETRQGALSVAVVASGDFEARLERLRQSGATDLEPPSSLNAVLRPYQRRGQSWLASMASLGLGACLADDMGLGKTVQLLAHLLRRQQQAPHDARPALLIAPTSVIGNWEREVERFAPSLTLTRHYGSGRAREPSDFPQAAGALVLTSYGLLRRDAALLAGVDWSAVALDEAQNIKNSASATARAARGLRASERFALTGTPVENRLAELWSILDFTNPGVLGPLETFRREFAVPIERYGREAAAARLRRIASPFVLRRLKSDPSIIADLPPKHEMKVVCTLGREQATLYKAVVDEELRRIASAEGMERRGRVLALLTATKQICDHPALYLSESGPLAQRSGKLERLTEMLEEAIAAGDKALVFTQYREMGQRLVAHLRAVLGRDVAFLHGGTPKAARDEMVRRFQEDELGPRVFVLSLKAGGTGLNLTAASHVFHYDRWWNPAVEDQATDRAYRIGQTRAVQVHKLVCAGSVEEKIDVLLEKKRELAAQVVGSGEAWITELGTDELRELFSLSSAAIIDAEDAPEAGEAVGKRAVAKAAVAKAAGSKTAAKAAGSSRKVAPSRRRAERT
jgi:superfamily II DNA or RNA helicase